jgi:hypothetical protein
MWQQCSPYVRCYHWCCWLQASTGLSLKATAGLRLLPGSKADDILAAVRTYLATLPFQVKAGTNCAAVAVDTRQHSFCKARAVAHDV